jgi:hypothetical protein
MKFDLRNNRTGTVFFFTRKILPVFIFFLGLLPFHRTFANGSLSNEETECLRLQGIESNSFDLGREFQILFYDRLHDIVVPSFLKSSSSSPLSPLNYKRIRPRGITGQQPTVVSPLLYRQTYYFAPDGSSFFQIRKHTFVPSISGKTCKIRPPPASGAGKTGPVV